MLSHYFICFFHLSLKLSRLFYLELKFIIMHVYTKTVLELSKLSLHFIFAHIHIYSAWKTLEMSKSNTPSPLSPSLFQLLRQLLYNRTRTQDTFRLLCLIFSNKGKARRGVADGGPDDDGDYATLRELPLITAMDSADDTASEENKVSLNLIQIQI